MTQKTCQEIEEHLVDFADGLLNDKTERPVSEHLESCDLCRQRVEALNRSLNLAQTIWQENLDQTDEKPIVRFAGISRLKRWCYAAAVILFCFGLTLYFITPSRPVTSPLTVEQVEWQLEVEASAARLLATAEILSQRQHAKELPKSQYRYLLNHYPATHAGTQARTKLSEL